LFPGLFLLQWQSGNKLFKSHLRTSHKARHTTGAQWTHSHSSASATLDWLQESPWTTKSVGAQVPYRNCSSQVCWWEPVVPPTWDTEAEGLLDPGTWRSARQHGEIQSQKYRTKDE
jgi:hypothetical protein